MAKRRAPVQEEMDMRLDYEKSIEDNIQTAIGFTQELLQIHNPLADPCHNRHEAYGIAAENLAEVQAKVKRLKDDLGMLLDALPSPASPVLESVSSIVNSASKLAVAAIRMTATMNIALGDLYSAEVDISPAEPVDPDQLDLASVDEGAFDTADSQ